ncbi:MAG: RedB protein [Candidatus Omnitrophica bacterium]|nr:RedB protein [Candidatus Omnitrophota bacterium]
MMKIKKKAFFILFIAAWFLLIAIGEGVLLNYGAKPGATAPPPGEWPAETSIPKNHDSPTLLMFVHPHCPCSRASIGELAIMAAHVQGKADIQVVFLKPGKFSDPWTKSDLWKQASGIPGVKVMVDENGKEAERFHALTSGQTLLYGVDGRLLFSGGITASRGHSGDNAGRSAVESILLKGSADRKQTPVFGCSLMDQKIDSFKRIFSLWQT